ncbi:hypothetical protein [Desulfolucanica intricata]|uniref:hypothetical protein n=1 Tax=Desulfolucanica intricata TaxID=1285191 RepID=UPI00082F4073|nr:hypothetical protein [Desulfolucanica intricata]
MLTAGAAAPGKAAAWGGSGNSPLPLLRIMAAAAFTGAVAWGLVELYKRQSPGPLLRCGWNGTLQSDKILDFSGTVRALRRSQKSLRETLLATVVHRGAAAPPMQLQTARLPRRLPIHTGPISPGTPRPGPLMGRALRVPSRAVVYLAGRWCLPGPPYGKAHIGAGLKTAEKLSPRSEVHLTRVV